MKKIVIAFSVFVFFIFSAFRLYAQNDSIMYSELNITYIKSGFKDTKDVLLAPANWNTSDWVLTAGLIGVTFLTSTQDDEIFNFFQQHRTRQTDAISKYGLEPWGSGLYSMSALGALYLGGKLTDNKRAQGAALSAVKSFVISTFYVTIAKQLIHRHRPYQAEEDSQNGAAEFSQYIIDGPVSSIKYTSFPSGHTNAIFSVASSIAYSYRDKPWVPVLAYSIATLTGVSRIHDKKHWASDVLMGAISGWAIGTFVTKNNELKYTPLVGYKSIGIVLDIN